MVLLLFKHVYQKTIQLYRLIDHVKINGFYIHTISGHNNIAHDNDNDCCNTVNIVLGFSM